MKVREAFGWIAAMFSRFFLSLLRAELLYECAHCFLSVLLMTANTAVHGHGARLKAHEGAEIGSEAEVLPFWNSFLLKRRKRTLKRITAGCGQRLPLVTAYPQPDVMSDLDSQSSN